MFGQGYDLEAGRARNAYVHGTLPGRRLYKTAPTAAKTVSFDAATGGGLGRIRSAAFSASIRTQALMWAETMSGMAEASATRRFSTPRTLSSGVSTQSGPLPIGQVPAG